MKNQSNQTIYDILKAEHETVQGILDRLDAARPAARPRLLEQLKAALLPHMHAEEQGLYKTLRALDDSHETALDAKEEHRAANHVLKELERLSPGSELWHPRFHVLKESIEHHVEEEEGTLFKKAREVLDAEQAVEQGRLFIELKAAYADAAAHPPVRKAV